MFTDPALRLGKQLLKEAHHPSGWMMLLEDAATSGVTVKHSLFHQFRSGGILFGLIGAFLEVNGLHSWGAG